MFTTMRITSCVIAMATMAAASAAQLPDDTRQIRTLEADQARELARRGGSLDLAGLKTLADDVARALAYHDGDLHLDGLTTLSLPAATALGVTRESFKRSRRDELSRRGLSALAQTMIVHDTQTLSLNGLTTLSEETARFLAFHTGTLVLNGLESLRPEVAVALARHTGLVRLDGLKALSPPVAAALAKRRLSMRGGESALSLAGLETLTPETAAELARHEGFLHLDGLRMLSEDAAAALGKHKGSLTLDGLRAIDERAAAALVQPARPPLPMLPFLGDDLSLGGLGALSPGLAQVLAKHHGRLRLDGVKDLSDEAAEALAAHPGGTLSLDGVTALSDRAAWALARPVPAPPRGFERLPSVSLRSLTTLSAEAAAALRENPRNELPERFRAAP